jgi:hypothetical protein
MKIVTRRLVVGYVARLLRIYEKIGLKGGNRWIIYVTVEQNCNTLQKRTDGFVQKVTLSTCVKSVRLLEKTLLYNGLRNISVGTVTNVKSMPNQ